jgi:hypothetical protein
MYSARYCCQVLMKLEFFREDFLKNKLKNQIA